MSSSCTADELLQLVPRHSPQATEHFSPIFLHVHLRELQSVLQLQQTISSKAAGAAVVGSSRPSARVHPHCCGSNAHSPDGSKRADGLLQSSYWNARFSDVFRVAVSRRWKSSCGSTGKDCPSISAHDLRSMVITVCFFLKIKPLAFFPAMDCRICPGDVSITPSRCWLTWLMPVLPDGRPTVTIRQKGSVGRPSDSVLCASEDSVILQSIRNTSIAPTWQFRL